MTINLGPVGGTFGTEPGPDGGLGYNPRVMKRDLGPAMNQRYCNYTTVLSKFLSFLLFLSVLAFFFLVPIVGRGAQPLFGLADKEKGKGSWRKEYKEEENEI